MTSFRSRAATALICALAAVSAGCDWLAPEPEAVLTAEGTLLEHVPADTPYVFAQVAPWPDDVVDLWKEQADALLPAYRRLLRAMLEDGGVDSELGDDGRRTLEELLDILDPQTLSESGLTRDSRSVLYGAGLLPVLRVTLAENHDFRGLLARVESTLGGEMSTASVDGQAYRYVGGAGSRLILALMDDELVVSIVPTELPEPDLETVLGMTLPARNIAESGRLREIADEHGLMPHAIGMIDNDRIAATFVEEQRGVNAALLALLDYDDSELSDVCKAEIRAVANTAPRIVAGYTELGAQRMSAELVVELRSDIASGLAGITAPVPGLGTVSGDTFTFGIGLDPARARDFLLERMDSLEADPFQCALFDDWQQELTEGREALSRPVPPVALSFKGIVAIVDDFEIDSGGTPTNLAASLVIASDNTRELLGMAAALSPDVAALNLSTDGRPVEFELPPTSGVALSDTTAFVAATDSALAVSTGADAEQRLTEILSAAPAEMPPFISMTVDMERYYALIREGLVAENELEARAPGMAPAVDDLLAQLQEFGYETTLEVRFTERGIETTSTVVLAD